MISLFKTLSETINSIQGDDTTANRSGSSSNGNRRSSRSRLKRTTSMIPFPEDILGQDNEAFHKNTTLPLECAGTFLSVTWGNEEETPFQKKGQPPPETIMKDIKEYCESKAMTDFCERSGLFGVQFTWNPAYDTIMEAGLCSSWRSTTVEQMLLRALVPINHIELYARFWDAYYDDHDETKDTSTSNNNTNHNHTIAVVFHGTPDDRVDHILNHGLDPKFRKTQAFGDGEYFSKEPGLASTYCKGGYAILVFIVYLPEETEKYYSQRDRDIVAISNIHHQLPIGVISFTKVDNAIVQHTQELRIEQKALKEDAVQKEKELSQAKQQDAGNITRIQQLEQEVHECWEKYFRMKYDENRNTREHIRTVAPEKEDKQQQQS